MFALFSQKPLSKFIYEYELSCNMKQCVSVHYVLHLYVLALFFQKPLFKYVDITNISCDIAAIV